MIAVGQCIHDRYDILSVLGQGGMSVVYLAQDRTMARKVALKTIRPDQSDEMDGQQNRLALLEEARLACSLNYSGIVTIHDRFELDGMVCIVMEYVEGLTLEKAIRIGAFTDRPAALRLLFRIADALDYAHSRNIVHRDVKPSNIIIRTDVADGEVKIADFGIAREAARGTTASTTAIGTLGYMSPEQAQGRRVDGRADQFSLAIVAHELLTRKLPYPSRQAVGVLSPAPDPGLGTGAVEVFRAALSVVPASRYRSCRDFIVALEWNLRPVVPSPGVQTKTAPRQASPWQGRRLGIAGGGLLLLIAVAMFGRSRWADTLKAYESPITNAKDGLEYTWIPAGEFRMGCVPNDPDCDSDEKPRHAVTLTNGFWIGRTEVTVAAFDTFVATNAGKMPDAPEFNPGWGAKDHPIVNVSWMEASAFCEWTGGRLPTEAEWEYSARGGKDGAIYPWGDTINHSNANYGTDDGSAGLIQGADRWLQTSPGASFPANDWSLADMAGNVNEWTKDWYSATYYKESPSVDPRGPASGVQHVFRSGGWGNPPKAMRSSWRYSGTPDVRRDFIGFRCALEQTPPRR